MCGIVGFVRAPGADDGQDRAVADAMCRVLAHRGPDDQGVHLEGGVALGHRRLSIIDLGGGHQPIGNEDGSVLVVINGEIYNFRELRGELEGLGHQFRTRSDSEALAHAYEQWGLDAVGRLNGMFAFAVWDSRSRRIVLGRDRMGQKPLFWAFRDGRLVFASELKAMLEHPAIERRVDPAALREYLAFEHVPAPRSFVEGVSKVEPGWLLVHEIGAPEAGVAPSTRFVQYWDVRFPEAPRESRGESARRLWDLLCTAAERQLVSDVPLGIFLSGGIDSSAVVAALAARRPPGSLDTFSIGFADETFDESSYAREVASHFGTCHHERILEPDAILEFLPNLLRVLDEPLGDGSVVPTYLLSRFTRERVTVALGGDGGDELFLGYPTFAAEIAASRLDRLPRPLLAGLERAAGLLPTSTGNISFDFKVKQFLKGMREGRNRRHFVWLGSFARSEQDDLLTSDVLAAAPDDPFAPVDRHLSRCAPRDRWDALVYLYSKLYFEGDILVKVDRASMACSLEVRAPFLDHELVEYVCSLPARRRISTLGTGKVVLRRALDGRVPPAVLTRAKKGFGMPIADWLKGPLRDWAESLLAPARIRDAGLLRPDAVDALWRDHLEGRRDNRKKLWTLIVLELWRERYGRSSCPRS